MNATEFAAAIQAVARVNEVEPNDFAIALAELLGIACAISDDPKHALHAVKELMDHAFEVAMLEGLDPAESAEREGEDDDAD